MKKKHIKKGFIEAGMIDEETGMVPVFEKLMGTCKIWVSNSKKIGISKVEKDNCRDQVTEMLIVHGGVTRNEHSGSRCTLSLTTKFEDRKNLAIK